MSSEVETSRLTTNADAAGFDSLTSRSLSLRPSRLCRDFPNASTVDFARDDNDASPSHLEAFAQIKLATDGIVDEEILSALALHAPIIN